MVAQAVPTKLAGMTGNDVKYFSIVFSSRNKVPMTAHPPVTDSPKAGLPCALYVVATPIGNLKDCSDRARDVLHRVAIIAAEDTRHTRILLQAFGIATPLVSFHEHNEAARTGPLVERMQRGEAVALVSDAGTPLLSDPGFELVRAALAAGIRVSPVPGPNAAVAALSASGLATDRFAFEGFLPPKAAARQIALSALARETRTLVFYEAPHRLPEVLDDMTRILGSDRRACVGRELTKRFESFYHGSLAELAAQSGQDPDMARGELVLMVAGLQKEKPMALALESESVLKILLEELPVAQAAKLAARITGEKRAALYDRAVQLGK